MPLVTVVVPAYNASTTLAETLHSALAQSLEDLEVVVVDDGSSDDTAEVAERAGPRVRCLQQANAGVSAARNRGIAASDSRYVAFLDADDLWLPDKLAAQVALFEARPDVGVTYTGATRIDADGAPVGGISARHHEDACRAMLLSSSILTLSSGTVRRDVLGDERFDPRFSQCADWHFWLRLGLRTGFGAIERELVGYRTMAGNMSSNVPLLERDTFGVLDDFYARPEAAPYLPIRRRAYSNHWMIVAGSYLHTGAIGDAVRCLGRGLLTDPSNVTRPAGLPIRWAGRAAGAIRRGRRRVGS